MQLLSNCHLTAFLEFEWTVQKSGQMTIQVLVRTICFNTLIMTIFQSAWLQLDISPCSYCYSIDSTLLGSALFTPPCCFCFVCMYVSVLKITAGHRTFSDQIQTMSDHIRNGRA